MPATLEQPEQVTAAAVRGAGGFDDSRFIKIENVPVFAEHRTTTPDGRELVFGQYELRAVCDRCNRRIAETGDYAAITIGHTPSPEAKSNGADDPPIIGFAGPFRMGTIGNGNRVRHAILTDFYVYRSDYELLRKYPRRSPELWLEDSYEEMFLDPIALLGAETPRLDLGLLYSAVHHGVQKHKYSAVEASATNSYLPSHVKPKRYSGDSGMSGMNNFDPEQAQAFMSLFEQSEMGQFIKAMMAERASGGSDGNAAADASEATGVDEPVETAAPPDAPPAAPAAPAGPPAADPMSGGDIPDAPPAEPTAPTGGAMPPAEDEADKELYSALDELEDGELEKYMSHRKARCSKVGYQAESGSVDDDGLPSGVGTVGNESIAPAGSNNAQYSRNGHGKMDYARQLRVANDTISDLKKQINREKIARVDAERLSTLNTMVADGYAIDPAWEMQRLCYSKANQQQFESAISLLVDHAPRAPLGETLPYSREGSRLAPGRPGSATAMEKYSQEVCAKALKYCKRMTQEGKSADYAHALELANKGEI